MNVEYFGRQFEITPAIRDEVESGLGKLTKILGDNFKSKVILTAEKHRHIAEITVKRRRGHLVGLAEATDMLVAVNQAIEHIETQVLKHNGRRRATHRKAKDKTWKAPVEADTEAQIAVGATAATAVPVVVHKFPPVARTTEAHLVRSQEAIAMRPMTVEEAVKECEFRDREVFIFRDAKGKVNVLHRRKDGKIELIEVP
ncbi:MAG TPA: ribosome-associated translation inhibitor RaiA [Verrucomicrobiae bacterium]|jgi:putative sigma-54 modulation protein|nr:ribosome-associated translation inhibitor RaiA [Verrucomicrobiae bacterium]